MEGVRESLVVQACIKWLYWHGCDVMRCNTGGFTKTYTSKKTGATKRYHVRFGKPGAGDILAISPYGRWVEIEAKAAKGEQREIQLRRQQEVERRGAVYILARSQDDLDARKPDILARHWDVAR